MNSNVVMRALAQPLDTHKVAAVMEAIIGHADVIHHRLPRVVDKRAAALLTGGFELTRQALAVVVRTKMGAVDVLEAFYLLLLRQGTPEYIRSDYGPEFAAEAMQACLRRVGIKPICIYPGSRWENG